MKAWPRTGPGAVAGERGRLAVGVRAVNVLAGAVALTLVLGLAPCSSFPAGGGEAGSTLNGADGSGPPAGFVVLTRVPTRERVVALTFDAGSDGGHTRALLEILEEEDVPATFFLTGTWIEQFPELARAVAEKGHDLGNHTATHPHLTALTDEEVLRELESTDEAALRATGRSLTPYFRPPYGEYDRRVASAAARAGYRYVVMWTVDSLDWRMVPAEELRRRVVEGAVPGGIILMHVGSATNLPGALPDIIRDLRGRGYRFGTLGDLLALMPAGAVLHTVLPGETLSGLARAYAVDPGAIMAANDLRAADSLRAWTTLLIPRGSPVSPPDRGVTTPGEPADPPDPSEPEPGDGGSDPREPDDRSLLGRAEDIWRTLVRLWNLVALLFGGLFRPG